MFPLLPSRQRGDSCSDFRIAINFLESHDE
jgi:hypothetical protein